MKDEIKEILDNIKKCCEIMQDENFVVYQKQDINKLLDYITNLQEEKEELKMTNLALADDITKNKIIKQEVLTECCGIPIGEIPMLKIQNDDYKTRIDKAIKYIEFEQKYSIPYKKELIELSNILQGKSDE